MITPNEFFTELKDLKTKSKFIKDTFPQNEIWEEVDKKLEDVLDLVKSDKKMYRW